MWQNAPVLQCGHSGRSQPASTRTSMGIRGLAAVLAVAALDAGATDVNVIGLFSDKAVVVINRGAPRTLRAGEITSEGVKLISADSRGAVLEIDGKRQTLEMGQHFEAAVPSGARSSVTLAPDSRGQY